MNHRTWRTQGLAVYHYNELAALCTSSDLAERLVAAVRFLEACEHEHDIR